jgi:TPR repeat protein
MKLRLSSFIGLLRLHHWMRHKSFCHLHYDNRAQSPVEMMKAKLLRSFLFFLLASAASQSPAQQSEEDRKLMADYRAKAEKGDASAQWMLGETFRLGTWGVATDHAEALRWYRKAAEQNDDVVSAAAQNKVGDFYSLGFGAAQDYVEAVKWWRKAAEHNHVWAQYSIGYAYQCGNGVPKDYAEAVKWYRKAAEQNYDFAQSVLSSCYFEGNGVVKNYIEAYKWALLAVAAAEFENSKEEYKRLVTRLERVMSLEQIAEGQRLANAFTPRKVPAPGSESSAAGIAQTRPESSGTGFFITGDGYLITNEHVAGSGKQVRLVTQSGLISAKVVKVDAANDLALLKTEGRFAPLPVAASRTVRMGSTVATVGFPNIGLQGFAPKLTKGEVGALTGAQDDPRYFQISVPVQPGNSGGALVDERGNVVGVVAAKLNVAAALATSGALPENVNYAVKSSLLLSFLESVPEVAGKLKEPNTKDQKFEDVVKYAEKAAVLVLVY